MKYIVLSQQCKTQNLINFYDVLELPVTYQSLIMNWQSIQDKGPTMNGIEMPVKPEKKLPFNPFEDILEEQKVDDNDFDDF
jgi:hypothetical protein